MPKVIVRAKIDLNTVLSVGDLITTEFSTFMVISREEYPCADCCGDDCEPDTLLSLLNLSTCGCTRIDGVYPPTIRNLGELFTRADFEHYSSDKYSITIDKED
jgi:hypothetical protein